MDFQDVIWLVTLTGMGLVTLGFIYVILRSGEDASAAEAQQAYQTSNRLRRWLFVALCVVFVGASYASLSTFPIPPQHTPLQSRQVIEVTGHQWYWDLSAAKIQAGVPVEFRVTSADVNHGFALYGPDGRIVAQTQAMPGYTNTLLYTFDTPGKYRVRCLEYCGLAHHNMEAVLEVIAAHEGGNTP